MFKKQLEQNLRAIFPGLKVTYLAPSDKFEQDTVFVDVLNSRSRMIAGNGGRETAIVDGMLTVYSQDNRLPFGFFAKAVERAAPAVTKSLFFFAMDTDVPDSPARVQNIHERRCSFRFTYDSQYDPNRGRITSVRFAEE